MRTLHSTILLHKLRFYAYHGVEPQEQLVGAYFLVTIEAEAQIATATESDFLSDTVSYADIFEVVKFEMSKPAKLLEYVANNIARHLLNSFPLLTRVKIELIKENPPMSADCKGAGIRIEVER